MYVFDDLNWDYSFDLGTRATITGGGNHPYSIGGTFSVHPFANSPAIRLDEGNGYLRAGVHDAYQNTIREIYYYGDNGSPEFLAMVSTNPAELEMRPSAQDPNPEVYLSYPSQNDGTLIAQEWVSADVVPTYLLTDGEGKPVDIEQVNYLSQYVDFIFSATTSPGIWNIQETVDPGAQRGDYKWVWEFHSLFPV